MISLVLAQQLKAAGLLWQPVLHDFFAVPDRDMDDRVFVLSDMMVYMELLRGWPMATFHGAVEWALDYVYLQELVWMPTEGQLRETLAGRLVNEPQPALRLASAVAGHRCEIDVYGQTLAFTANKASDAYGAALLYLMQNGYDPNGQSQMSA